MVAAIGEMMETHYRNQAAQCAAEAAATSLHNVRDRCLRAETAWLRMASRAAATARQKAEIEARAAEKKLALG